MKTNEVQLKGKLLYVYKTPARGNIILKIGSKGNVVQCFTANEQLKKQIKEFEVGDYINLNGNIQSSVNNGQCTQTVFIESVVPPDEYTDEGFYNKFWLDGIVVKIKDLPNCMRITIKTENSGRISYVPVVFYHPDVRRLNFEVGEHIRTCGSIQSVRKKSSNGEFIYYQNYVGSQYMTG